VTYERKEKKPTIHKDKIVFRTRLIYDTMLEISHRKFKISANSMLNVLMKTVDNMKIR
jgi:hypothetical protein